MSTHVIKRRAITTPSYRISSELRCFGFFFLSREWLCLGALYRDLGQKIPDLVKLLSNSIKLEKNAKNQTLNKGAVPL